MKKLAILFTFVFISACATKPIPLDDGADIVRISETEPGEGYKVVGLLTATNGHGCGDFGVEGNRENVITTLKNDAHALGSDYVQILNVIEPHVSGGCYDNKYIINATAFKKSHGSEAVTQKDSPSDAQATQSNDASDEAFTKKLRELKALRDDGILSEEEYQQQKQRLLEKGI